MFVRTPVFIVACGRSGTTLLGQLFSMHPSTRYLFEPYHLWTGVDPRTDMTHLFTRGRASCSLSAFDADDRVRARFDAVFGPHAESGGLMVEKTPINALRLGYLDALAPGARFINILRDGVDVARSIERVATGNTYRIAGKRNFNQWWGENDVKWRLLARDGAALGYAPIDVSSISTHAQRGAYEWIVSVGEVDRARELLGDRLLDIRYADLLARPRETLQRMVEHMGLDAPASWVAECESRIKPDRGGEGGVITLPDEVAECFNELQRRHGFTGCAVTERGPERRAVTSPGPYRATASPCSAGKGRVSQPT